MTDPAAFTPGPNTRLHGIRPCQRRSRFAEARFRMHLLALIRPDFDAAVRDAVDAALIGDDTRPVLRGLNPTPLPPLVAEEAPNR